MELSVAQRPAALETLGRWTFDLVIIGGGITGASIARAAALRGYTVALLEQDDLGSGTSSRSSRLIHGGLRYLEHGELGLVFESLAERALLARVARHIVRPQRFVLPVYKQDRVGMGQARLGLWLYDTLALFRNYRRHQSLSAAEAAMQVEGIRQAGLSGAIAYYDYRTDDSRLVLENILSAVELGAVVASHARVEGFDRTASGVRCVQVHDRLGGARFEVRTRAIMCAAGPWTDGVLGTGRWLRPTKGVHVVVPRERLAVDNAVVMQHPGDGRVMFVLPFHERTVLGTTDTDFDGDPTSAVPDARDVSYLLQAAAHYFPGAHLGSDDVISSWAGVRPLVRAPTGVLHSALQSGSPTPRAEVDDPSAVSREHRIETLPGGIVVVAGGKLTTYRRMAAQCLAAVTRVIAESGGSPSRGPVAGEKGPLPGAMGLEREEQFEALCQRTVQQIEDQTLAHQLCQTYGVRAQQVVLLMHQRPELARRLVPELPIVWAQVVFAARHELALTLCDVLVRRTQLVYRDAGRGLDVALHAAEVMGDELGWDTVERQRQVEAYRQLVRTDHPTGREAG